MKSYTGYRVYPYVVSYKDNRKKMNIVYLNKYKAEAGCNTIMKYLLTLLVISTILLISMKISDVYFDHVRQAIEDTQIEMDQLSVALSKAVNIVMDTIEVDIADDHYENSILADRASNEIIVHQLIADEINDVASTEETVEISPHSSILADMTLTAEQLEFIERVVEAEVTGTTYKYDGEHVNEEEMLKAKIRVCQVFLNRVYDTERFPHITNLYEAVSETNASSTVASGRYLRVEVTDLTKEAVQLALDPNTDDLTDGALFFLAGGETYNKYGDYIFTDAVGHSFFK